MRTRLFLPLCAATALFLSGCSGDGGGGSKESADASARPSASPEESDPSEGGGREWEPDDALQRAKRALDSAADDGGEPEFVDSGSAYVASGLDKEFTATGARPYRFDITCDTSGIEEVTLTLSRDGEEQSYGIGCGDADADQFNVPAGRPFTARVDPVKDGTGLIMWRLHTLAKDAVDGCDDDIDGCED
ncbi:hypothetical protein [Streptomyces sp. NPDC059009]|uniref:hypothetical protein n=1 Tax=Streptomyces sp. NPDC059009 TaxID=3346694 RepID=UPI0036B1848B